MRRLEDFVFLVGRAPRAIGRGSRSFWLGMSVRTIHEPPVAKEAGLDKATAAFEAIYLAFLGRTKGPRAGWFLAFLERGFVIARLKEAAS